MVACLSKQLSAAEARVAELEAEVPWLKDMRVQNGVLDITIEGARAALGRMCDALAVSFEADKGINYVQYEVRSRGREFILALQKASGKTPHQLRTEAEQRVAELGKILSALLGRIDAKPTMSGHLRAMRLRLDHGESHETSDAIRAARAVLSEAP